MAPVGQSESQETSTCETEQGTLTIWTVRPALYTTLAQGVMGEDHMDFIIAFTEGELAKGHREFVFFHDWNQVQRIRAAARVTVTAWMVRHLAVYRGVYIVTDSKLLAMSASVVSLATRGLLQVCEDTSVLRQRFEAELGRA